MSVDDYSVEAKRVIAIAIENAIKHITSASDLDQQPAGEDDEDKMAKYWPIGSQACEQSGLLAIETFIKVLVA